MIAVSHFLGPQTKLAELHVHLGSSVDPAVMWEIAHAQGIKLPTKDYWRFTDMITVNPRKVKSFEDYLEMFKWTELIQSSPLAIENSVYHTIAGAYRKNNITLLELRFNPMKRNRGGEQDLDQIMMAAIRGIDRSSLEYPVRTGLIVCFDRTFSHAQNEILLEKALRYQSRGVVGIDIAGPHSARFRYSECKDLYRRARAEGLGLTVHAGEDEGHDSVRDVIKHLEPDRIGHGVRAIENGRTLEMVQRQGDNPGGLPFLEPQHARHKGSRAHEGGLQGLRVPPHQVHDKHRRSRDAGDEPEGGVRLPPPQRNPGRRGRPEGEQIRLRRLVHQVGSRWERISLPSWTAARDCHRGSPPRTGRRASTRGYSGRRVLLPHEAWDDPGRSGRPVRDQRGPGLEEGEEVREEPADAEMSPRRPSPLTSGRASVRRRRATSRSPS